MARIPLKHLNDDEKNKYYEHKQAMKFHTQEIRQLREEKAKIAREEKAKIQLFKQNFLTHLQAAFSTYAELKETPVSQVHKRMIELLGTDLSRIEFSYLMYEHGFTQHNMRDHWSDGTNKPRRVWRKNDDTPTPKGLQS